MTRPPTAADWKPKVTDEDWEKHARDARIRLGDIDSYPRSLRLFLHEWGEIPTWQMSMILGALRSGKTVEVVAPNGRRYRLHPDSFAPSAKRKPARRQSGASAAG
jgi:hypothetical protein